MTGRTTWTATREELVAALQRARVEAATAQAVLAKVEAQRATRLARESEARAQRRAEKAALAQSAIDAAGALVQPDPLAAHHRWVLEQALTDPRYRKESA